MELYAEILKKVLEEEKAEVYFPELKLNAKEIVETECYKALKKIKDIISDTSLSDKECFMQIEYIICTLEDLGSRDCGGRHDF